MTKLAIFAPFSPLLHLEGKSETDRLKTFKCLVSGHLYFGFISIFGIFGNLQLKVLKDKTTQRFFYKFIL